MTWPGSDPGAAASVVPQVVEQFDTVGQELPLLTRIVIGVSALITGWWWLMRYVNKTKREMDRIAGIGK